MPSAGIPKSTITLKTYQAILRNCAEGKQQLPGKYGHVNSALMALKKDGLIFFPDVAEQDDIYGQSVGRQSPPFITPLGCKALIEWRTFLRENRWWYKMLTAVSRLAWVLVGAIAASLLDILKLFFN